MNNLLKQISLIDNKADLDLIIGQVKWREPTSTTIESQKLKHTLALAIPFRSHAANAVS